MAGATFCCSRDNTEEEKLTCLAWKRSYVGGQLRSWMGRETDRTIGTFRLPDYNFFVIESF